MSEFKSITQINPKRGDFLKNIDGSIWLYKGIEDEFVQLLCTESSPQSVKKVGDTRKLNTYNAEFLFDWLPYKIETAEEDEEGEDFADTEEGEMHQLEKEMSFEKIEIEPTPEQKNLEGAISQLLFTQTANTGDDEEFAEAEEVVEEVIVEEVVLAQKEEATKKPKKIKAPRAEKIEPQAATVEAKEPKAETTTAAAPSLFWHNGRMKQCLLIHGFNNEKKLLFDDDQVFKYVEEYVQAYDGQERFVTCGNLLIFENQNNEAPPAFEENSPEWLRYVAQINRMVVTTGEWRLSHSILEFEAILIGGERGWFKIDAGWRTKVF